MNRMLRPLLLLLLCAASSFFAQAAGEQPLPPATPEELLKVWKDYGLPLPPAEAPLVRFTTGIRSLFPDKEKWHSEERWHYGIGFLLKPATGEEPAVILSGSIEFRQDHGGPRQLGVKLDEIKPAAAGLTGILLKAELEMAGPNALLGAALQCEARGWTEFAALLLKEALQQGAGHHFSIEYQPPGCSGPDAVHIAVWQYLRRQAMHPGADRSAIAAKMKRLLDSGHDLRRNSGQRLYEATLAAAQPGQGAPGSPEALIDRLIDSQKNGGAVSAPREVNPNDPYYQLEALGFAAVPALLEHLDDRRLTCSMTVGFDNFPDWPRRVRDLVADLLQGIAGSELGTSWLDRQNSAVPSLKTVQGWWENARAEGEETYLVKHASASSNDAQSFPNACHLRILKARYPERLADVMHTQMKTRPKAQIHPVLTAIEGSALPKEEKAALFREAALHSNPDTRRIALSHLARLDLAWFQAEAIKAFDAMKTKPSESFWTCPEAGLAHLALLTADDAVWAAFLRAAQRAETGLRMELMKPLNYKHVGDSFRPQRLIFLAAFLDDTTLRVMPGGEKARRKVKLDGPCAAFTIPRLRVCDFAAMQIAGILLWPDRPDEKWTEQQWDDLRTRVKKAPEISSP